METIFNFALNALIPLQNVCTRLLAFLPPVVAAMVLLLAGLWACHWFRIIVDHACKLVRVDEVARRIGLSTVLYRLGLGPSAAYLAGILVTAVIVLSAVLAAADVAGLPVVPEFLRTMASVAPRILGVVLILGGGLFLGDLAGRIVNRAADANHIKGSEALMRVTHGLFVIFSGFMAFEHLGIDAVGILTNSMQIIVAAIGLGAAIAVGVAFGMAGRDTAEKWIRDLTPKSKAPANHDVKMRVMR